MAPPEPSSTEAQASKPTGAEQDDKDFDPAEASIEEIDDERTLEEEEAMAAKNKEAVKEELDSLEREAEMPIEELRAHYEKLRQEKGATTGANEAEEGDEGEDDDDEGGDDDDENDDDDDDDDDDDVDDDDDDEDDVDDGDDDDDEDSDDDLDDEGDDEDAENSEDGQNGDVANGKTKKSTIKPSKESPAKRVKVDNSQSKDAPKQDS